jgi:hypothetical protein
LLDHAIGRNGLAWLHPQQVAHRNAAHRNLLKRAVMGLAFCSVGQAVHHRFQCPGGTLA